MLQYQCCRNLWLAWCLGVRRLGYQDTGGLVRSAIVVGLHLGTIVLHLAKIDGHLSRFM